MAAHSSTAGAIHLAESAQWLAAQHQPERPPPYTTATLFEQARTHWSAETFGRFAAWWVHLPSGTPQERAA